MRIINNSWAVFLLLLTAAAALSTPAQAHLMVAQQGTLNIVDDGVFMVLSLPISAFDYIDDNGDGEVTMVEFNKHRVAIVASVRDNIRLSDGDKNLLLAGIMLSPEVSHNTSLPVLAQLTVMGKFEIADASGELQIHVGLFGQQAAEQSLKITATRKADNRKNELILTPAAPAGQLLPVVLNARLPTI